MTKEEIKNGNKLISEFCGYMVIQNYYNDWNHLMYAINKITEIDITPAPNWSGYRVEIVPRGYVQISGFPMIPKISKNISIEGNLQKATFKAVLDFVEYHNKTKT